LRILKGILEGLLDIVYPPYCVVCGLSDPEWFCPDCRLKIEYLEPPYCIRCGIPCTTGLCSDCRDSKHLFTSANSATLFSAPVVEVVHQFKYGGHIVLADSLAEIMVERLPKTELQGKFDLIVAIPEEDSRLVERGFNQAEELASRLALAVSCEYLPNVLKKTRKTSRQVGLSAEARAVNLLEAYGVSLPGTIDGRNVLVVDDVMTTGSTLEEAARALKEAGASHVRGYTLARGI